MKKVDTRRSAQLPQQPENKRSWGATVALDCTKKQCIYRITDGTNSGTDRRSASESKHCSIAFLCHQGSIEITDFDDWV